MVETPLENAERPRRVLERIVLRRGSFRGLGTRCGRSPMWIWRQLRENKGLDLVKTEKVLDQLGVPARFFYEELEDESAAYEPAWLLEHFRDGSESPRDPFLDEVEGRLSDLLERPASIGGERHRRAIAEPEEGRFFDRDKAKLDLELLARKILRSAADAPRIPRGHLADLAHTLLIWGAIQRALGMRDDCTDAYRMAYRLTVAGRDSKVTGVFYYYASHYLTMELDRPALGLRFAESACAIFQQLRDPDMLSQALVQSAIALLDLNRFDEQRARAIAALRLAPRLSWRVRATAWIQLGNTALARGKARAALGKMLRAHRWSEGAFYMEAFVLRRLGQIRREVEVPAYSCHPVGEAPEYFHRSLVISEEVGQDFEAILTVIDLADLLTSTSRLAEAAAAVRRTMPLFEKLDGSTELYSQWFDLLALLLRGARETAHRQVLSVREAVQADATKIRLFLGNSRSPFRRHGVGLPLLMKSQES